MAPCLVLLLLLAPADLLAYAHVNMDQHGPREDRLHDQRLVPNRRMPPLPAAYHRSLSSMPVPTPYLLIPTVLTHPLPTPYILTSVLVCVCGSVGRHASRLSVSSTSAYLFTLCGVMVG